MAILTYSSVVFKLSHPELSAVWMISDRAYMRSKPFSRMNRDVQNVDLWSSPHCPSPGHQREGKGGACSQGGKLSGTARVHSDPPGAAADLLPSSHPSRDHVQCKIVFKGQAQKMQSLYLWIS